MMKYFCILDIFFILNKHLNEKNFISYNFQKIITFMDYF